MMKQLLVTIITVMAVLMAAGLAGAVQEEQYHIKPGDHLSIYVHENPDLTVSPTVLGDGTISYPLVGNLYVAGLTISGLQDILTQKLSSFLQKPAVVVTISSETVDKIYILGEVRSPSAYPYENGFRLTDYLAIAGGPAPNANWNKCSIYSVDPGTSKRTINLKYTFQSRDLTQNPILKPNDTVYLEKKSGFIINNWGEISQVLGILVGSATLYFLVNNTRR
jgi:polysaccharide biosynthesis/export protein